MPAARRCDGTTTRAVPGRLLAVLLLACAAAGSHAGQQTGTACLARPMAGSPSSVFATQGDTVVVEVARQDHGRAPDARLVVRKPGDGGSSQDIAVGVRTPLFSALVTKGLPGTVLSVATLGGREFTGVLREGAAPSLLALVVTEDASQGGRMTSTHWLAQDASAEAAPATVAALELLYAHLSRMPPENAYALVAGNPPAQQPTSMARTQGEVLAQIARWRSCAAAAMPAHPANAALRPWQTIDLQPRTGPLLAGGDGHLVSVTVRAGTEALRQGSVIFTRQPHLVCQADVGPDGVASCRLADAHFHEHVHDNEGDVTVATFSGVMGGAAILPPMTAQWRHPQRSFAQPFDWRPASSKRP
ncbi:hypothetical protein [Pseudorhodoferax sp.]|uniref:hypothetical protein n=1 Tax=Pseudorhodoferax sp. TaxID=1993553 RepID=UPI002DD69F51|nr:hypothetical protein [Pseudorhodoferax sp.]